MVELPATLLAEIDALVEGGEFATREIATTEIVRLGLDAWRARRTPRREPVPGRPAPPPGIRNPGDDRPIEINPTDVNWMRAAGLPKAKDFHDVPKE